MIPPEFIKTVACAVVSPPLEGNRHWRVACPVCQPFPGGGRSRMLVLWEGRNQGWRIACLSSNPSCTPTALRLAIHRLLNVGKTEPKLTLINDTVMEGTLRAQQIFAEGEPVRKGDACDLFLRRYRIDFDPGLFKYVRWGRGNRPTEVALIEGLVDPIAAFDPSTDEPPILGVTITYLRRTGEPVIIASPDIPKMKHIGRRRGMACPLGPIDQWNGETIAISVRAAHTLRLMQSAGLSYGLAVATAETLPQAYLPLGERFQYEVAVADNGLALALAEALKESMEAGGSSVYIDVNKDIGKQQRIRRVVAI